MATIIQSGVSALSALQTAKHLLFVEGSSDETFDPTVIRELLKANNTPQVDVQGMGACDNVRSAAQALIHEHPSYYFLIDRDDQDLTLVEAYWANFPDPTTHNLLIWRKREVENYFIEPDYIAQSTYLKVTLPVLRAAILKEANKRVFMDAVNLVIMSLHREVGRPFALHFRNPDDFKKESDGLNLLLGLGEIPAKRTSVSNELDPAMLGVRYQHHLDEITGGKIPLVYGTGAWLDLMSGKEIFRAIAGKCFQVRDLTGKLVQGRDQHNEIAKELLKRPLAHQPTDFQQLVALIRKRVATA
jgi:hypothetical protein